ncbi:MAG: transposase [Candidatus Bipolaricaulia bacterium]
MAHRQSRNWVQYNEQLVRRGEILLKVDVLKDWHQEIARMNEGKRGHPFVYPETLMLPLGMIRAAFHLPYRQLEGFARALGKLTHLPAPDYTTFSLRLPQLRLDPEPQLDPEEPVILVVDSTGIKRTHRGHWLEEVHSTPS